MTAKILLIDDEDIELVGLTHMIESFHLPIEISGVCRNGVDGVDKVLTIKPDMIITDIRMPRLSGIEMLEKLKERAFQTHVIIISGYEDFHAAKKGMALGAKAYLLKPVSRDELYTALCNVLEAMGLKTEKSKIAVPAPPETDDDFLNECNAAQVIEKIIKIVQQDFILPLSVDAIAKRVYLSPSYIRRLFKNYTGVTLTNYILSVRMEKALEYCSVLQYHVYEIGGLVGYDSPSYFNMVFKKYYGTTPGEVRKRFRNA